MAKTQMVKQISDLVKLTLVWNFRSYSPLRSNKTTYATGPEHDKERHGMELLNKLNKSPLVTFSQKG